uniref:Solute carrier family 5 member 8 n=1 Tax=Mastacembelus armatus TaxID=205130 RepID=A0A7N8XAM8_9TELE
MPGYALLSGSFVTADYLVFALMLLVSAAVGVYYAWTDRDQRSSGNFLIGGRRMTALPVSLSLTASFMSAITVLSNPAEVYRYGASIGFYIIAFAMAVLVTSEVFMPVFYRLTITSTYEVSVQIRICHFTVFLLFSVISVFNGFQMFCSAVVVQLTGMDLWGAVISTGVVCTFYCTMGGLKAVVWTDVFQLGVMLGGFLSVIIRSVVLQGGVFPIISDTQQGGRLNIWDFDINPLRRHTFWTITIGGTFIWVSIYGINQAQVQRYNSCKSLIHAKLSLYTNLLGLWSILLCSVFAGMCLYSVYKKCDPWTAGLVSAPDQLMPYLVMDILGDYPGLPGLFVAAAYSGSLSTVSSSINALAAVTVEDLIKPCTNMSEKHLSWTSKGLSLLYGALCIGMAALASLMGGILQAAVSIFGVTGGPLLGLFTLGILCPFANSKVTVSGLLSGLVVSLWVGITAQIYPPSPEMSRPLSLTTEGCNLTTVDSLNWTSTTLPPQPSSITTVHGRPLLAESWYSLSYLYFSPIGTCSASSDLVLNAIITLITATDICFMLFLLQVIRTGKLDLTKDRENNFGNTNPDFYDVELEFAKSNIPT